MKHISTLSILLFCSILAQAQPSLSGQLDTSYFKQSDFEWHVTPRHDYSRTLVGKFFLSQAHWDQQFKLRDNGEQTVYMDCGQALEAIKAMDAITMGMDKVIYLVGWQYNGHDSKYPAFFECNEAIKAPGDESAHESILKLMEEARKYNTSVSFHINMFNCYDDSPLFEKYKEDDVLARHINGEYLHSDWGWTVSYARDWATGNAQARLDRLCELFPIAESGTLHIDAFHTNVPVPVVEGDEIVIRYMSPISPYHKLTVEDEIEAQLNIIRYLDAKGIDVTCEGWSNDAFSGYIPAVWHKTVRNLYLTMTPSQIGGTNADYMGDVFGRNVNTEQAFKDGGDTMAEKTETFKKEFCRKSLPCMYLNTLTPVAYVASKDCDDAEAIFSNGVRTFFIEEGEKFFMYKDGEKMAEDGNLFIPALWAGEGVVVAYSENGYEKMEWTVPSEIKVRSFAKAYVVDAEGQHYAGKVKVRGRKVTLSLKPGEMLRLEFSNVNSL